MCTLANIVEQACKIQQPLPFTKVRCTIQQSSAISKVRCRIQQPLPFAKVRWFTQSQHTFQCLCAFSISFNTLVSIRMVKGAQSYLFNFFSNFWRFWYHKKAHVFLITHDNFTAETCSVWKILMKICLVMVTIIKLTQQDISNCNIQNCFILSISLNVSTEIWNSHIWSDDSLNETEN